MSNGGRVQTLREGTWLYDGSVPLRVRLVREDWDDDFTPAGDPEDEEEVYRFAFYVQYEMAGADGWSGVAGQFHRTEEDALADASGLLPTLKWNTDGVGRPRRVYGTMRFKSSATSRALWRTATMVSGALTKSYTTRHE